MNKITSSVDSGGTVFASACENSDLVLSTSNTLYMVVRDQGIARFLDLATGCFFRESCITGRCIQKGEKFTIEVI